MELWRHYESNLHLIVAGLSFAFVAAIATGVLH
jgi:hypothetical protein